MISSRVEVIFLKKVNFNLSYISKRDGALIRPLIWVFTDLLRYIASILLCLYAV